MKRLIAVLLLTSFSCGTFASYVVDDGQAKTELVKKSYDLVAVEVSQPIEIDPPAVRPINHITGEVNVKAITRPKEAVANGPPITGLELILYNSHRIRAVTYPF
jgi:hypothetical protein